MAGHTGKSTRSDASANRERIFNAALAVFRKKGLDAEMKDIAKSAGVGVGTLYRHFHGREALLAEVVERAMKEMLEELRIGVKGLEPKVAVGTMIHTAAEACDRFGALAEVVLSGKVGDSTGFKNLLAEILRSGVQQGAFRSGLDVPLAVAVVESVVSSGVFLRMAGQKSSGIAAEALEDFFLRAILPG